MIFLYIFWGIILILFILLCCPVKVYVSFESYLVVKMKFLFFSVDLIPSKKNESDGKKSEKNQFKSHDNKIWSIIKEKGFFGFLKILKSIVDIFLASSKRVLKKIHINYFDLHLLIAEDDAAETAVGYAKVYAFISYVKSVLLRNVNENKCYIEVIPGFYDNECKVNFSSKFYFFPISMVGIVLQTLFKFVKNMYVSTISERV